MHPRNAVTHDGYNSQGIIPICDLVSLALYFVCSFGDINSPNNQGLETSRWCGL